MADKVGEWAGIPLPIEGEKLVVSPRFIFSEVLNSAAKTAVDPVDDTEALISAGRIKPRNSFYSTRYRVEVHVWEEDGKIMHGVIPANGSFEFALRTMGCSAAWGVEQEHNALKLLGEMIDHRRFKQYLLTGMFLETSKRSGVTYAFRKLRPTVALSTSGPTIRVLCAMCLHPIGYYQDSWAGAMCPTDDVIAHLQLMRGDEHLFWKNCTQHEPGRPQAGM